MSIIVPAVGDQATASWADGVANAVNGVFQGDAASAGTVTLSTTSNFAGLATVTFTLAVQTRIKISVAAQIGQVTAASGAYLVNPGYNSGSSAVIASVITAGISVRVACEGAAIRARSGVNVGTALLAAGTYTAYAVVARNAGGTATDTVSNFYTLVEAIGFV